jgi:hypothetical protein
VSSPELHRVLLHPLHKTGIAYMVTGAVAAIAYGEPRMTNDVDLVVQLEPTDSDKLTDAFASTEYYVPPPEVIEEERLRQRHGHFNIIHYDSALRADIYLVGDDPLHEWAMARRRTAPIGGDAVWIAPPEYVIVRKLEYFEQSASDRHLRDIAGMLGVSSEQIDQGVLARLIAERELDTTWRRVSELAP